MSMLLCLLLWVHGGTQFSTRVTYTCDRLELNNCYDEFGKLRFRQVLVWKHVKGKPDKVIYWFFPKDGLGGEPRRFRDNQYEAITSGLDQQDIRLVSRVFTETWTDYDPEELNRRFYAIETRYELQHLFKPPQILHFWHGPGR